MDIQTLVDKYFGLIEIEDTDYVPVDDAVSDAAYLLLDIPIAMLEEYARLHDQKMPPNGEEFWKETQLASRLRNSGKYRGQGHEPLSDILDFLEGDVAVHYQSLSPSVMRMSVYEIPRFHDGQIFI